MLDTRMTDRLSKIRDLRVITVHSRPGVRSQGLATAGGRNLACALGPSGILAKKREGDGATPAGDWGLLEVLYRPDRRARPRTGLPVRPIRPADGWCDAPGDRNYNRAVALPYAASAETLWRDDGIYDLVVVLDHNQRPRRRNGGSAVFLHIARPGFSPTQGCVAFRERDLEWLLARCGPGSRIRIVP